LQTRIAAFSPADYPTFTALWNEAYPDLKRTELEMRLFDLSLAQQPPLRRWLAISEDTVVGFAGFELLDGGSVPERKCQLHLFVSPDFRRQGIGSSLFDEMIAELRMIAPIMVRTWTRQDLNDSVSFLVARGFAEQMRTFHSALECAAFDLSQVEKYLRRLEKYGYEFKAFPDLAEDPRRNRATYDLYCQVMPDIPSPEAPQLPTFDDYEQKILNSPEFFRSHFLAVKGAEYVGLCILLPRDRARHELYADTLGVKPAYRGRGIAQALSYRGIEYAKSRGYALISADSFVENHRIRGLLNRLGFGNESVWTQFAKCV